MQYLEAGADVIISSSYQVSAGFHLQRNLEETTDQILLFIVVFHVKLEKKGLLHVSIQ